ncbi:MerR family DNA-binding transcriptional regulator [Aquibium sp. ELW1220]|uniref:MerR family transcriptional regulator n=1 Tax=Aquibium sp. ELW1220 TaxID=2976766 RepID=UPI0025B07FE8|nr:MerR family DNA-binding transcriptional regulator [Aquibium sp. ELW1220]MDN2582951.1 MerR family DNA-binding transcriptional regulator [Aquibium sp. ELW1220]
MEFNDFDEIEQPIGFLYTISGLSNEFKVTHRALRYYEQKGLLSPLRSGQQRLYSYRDRARLQVILHSKRFGLTIAEIKELLDLYEPAGENRLQITKAIEIGERQLALLKLERDEVDSSIKGLERTLLCLREKISEVEG